MLTAHPTHVVGPAGEVLAREPLPGSDYSIEVLLGGNDGGLHWRLAGPGFATVERKLTPNLVGGVEQVRGVDVGVRETRIAWGSGSTPPSVRARAPRRFGRARVTELEVAFVAGRLWAAELPPSTHEVEVTSGGVREVRFCG